MSTNHAQDQSKLSPAPSALSSPLSDKSTANGDSWKELADKVASKKLGEGGQQPGLTLRKMIARLDERAPFAAATGVLDVGCGTGAVISHILEEHGGKIPSSATIAAADFSEAMLEKLRETKQSNASKPGWDRLQLHRLDAHDLSAIPDGSFSHVTGGHVYFLLSNPRQALKETHRILARGGMLATSSGKCSEHLDALHDAVEAVRPGTNLQLIREPWTSEQGVQSELEACGFTDVETFAIETEMRYEAHDDFAQVLLVMPVMKEATRGYDDTEKKTLLEKLVHALRQKNPSAPGSLKGTSIVALARRT
jgi:SAM-dependent methyltransferase